MFRHHVCVTGELDLAAACRPHHGPIRDDSERLAATARTRRSHQPTDHDCLTATGAGAQGILDGNRHAACSGRRQRRMIAGHGAQSLGQLLEAHPRECRAIVDRGARGHGLGGQLRGRAIGDGCGQHLGDDRCHPGCGPRFVDQEVANLLQALPSEPSPKIGEARVAQDLGIHFHQIADRFGKGPRQLLHGPRRRRAPTDQAVSRADDRVELAGVGLAAPPTTRPDHPHDQQQDHTHGDRDGRAQERFRLDLQAPGVGGQSQSSPGAQSHGDPMRGPQGPPAPGNRELDPQEVADRLSQGFEGILEIVRLLEHAKEAARRVMKLPKVGGPLQDVLIGGISDDEQGDARLANLVPQRREVARALPLRVRKVPPVGDQQQEPERNGLRGEIGEIQSHGVDQVRPVVFERRHLLVEAADVGGEEAGAPLAHATVHGRQHGRARGHSLEERVNAIQNAPGHTLDPQINQTRHQRRAPGRAVLGGHRSPIREGLTGCRERRQRSVRQDLDARDLEGAPVVVYPSDEHRVVAALRIERGPGGDQDRRRDAVRRADEQGGQAQCRCRCQPARRHRARPEGGSQRDLNRSSVEPTLIVSPSLSRITCPGASF